MDSEFSGARLRVAREFGGLTQAQVAKKLVVTPAFVCQLEQGRKQPAKETWLALADVLGFDAEFFCLPVASEFRDDECNFRRRRTTPLYIRNQALAHGTLFGTIVDYLEQRLRFPKSDVPHLTATGRAEVERAAERARLHWGLGIDLPITNMMRVVEQRAGAVATCFEGISDKIDAFSRVGSRDVVVFNPAKGSASRSRYDLAHELGHLIMHRGMETGTGEAEDQANQFAAAFLLPRVAFAREFGRPSRIDWTSAFALKQRWGASVAAIVRRAYDLQLIGAAEYRRAYKHIHAKGWHKGEPGEPAPEARELPEMIPLAFAELERACRVTAWDVAQELRLSGSMLERLTGGAVKARVPSRRVLRAVGRQQST